MLALIVNPTGDMQPRERFTCKVGRMFKVRSPTSNSYLNIDGLNFVKKHYKILKVKEE